MKKIKVKKVINLWLPAIFWALVIFLFSSRPTRPTSEIYWEDFIVKKTAHIIEYGIFALLLYRGFKESGVEVRKSGFYAIFIAVLYGFSDEFHQSFTPGRDARVRDIIFDTIGASLAIYLVWRLLPKAPKKLKNLARSLQLL